MPGPLPQESACGSSSLPRILGRSFLRTGQTALLSIASTSAFLVVSAPWAQVAAQAAGAADNQPAKFCQHEHDELEFRSMPSPTAGRTIGPTVIGGPQHSSDCPAQNARTNSVAPYKTNLDFVPVTTDDSLGFHVAYSGRTSFSGGQSVAFNVGIFLFPLSDGSLLVFGGGYGDPQGAGTAANSAAYDVANVDAYVRQCLGQTPQNTPIEFVSPHWHGDHINEDFIRQLASKGYNVRSIWYHEDDDSYIRSYYNWTAAEIAKFKTFPDAGCNVEIGSFQSTLGKIWFIARSGHAPGAIDLVLDVRGNIYDRVLVLGSEAGGNCPTPPPYVRWTHNAHGNVTVPIAPEEVPFGCGLNAPGSLVVLSGQAQLGTTLTVGIDDPRGDVAPGSIPMLFSSNKPDPNLPCGTPVQLPFMVRTFEILIDTLNGSGFTPPLMGGPWAGPGQPSAIAVAIPLDPSAVGSSFYLQGALFELGGGGSVLTGMMLTEGMELRLAR